MMTNKEYETIKKNIMKQNPYPSILHTAQKSAFRQRGIGGSLLRTALAVLLLASAAACSDDNSNDIPGDGDDNTGNAANLVTVRFASGTDDDATPEARTTIDPTDGVTVKWKTGDEIGISAVRTDNTASTVTNVTNKKYNPATADVNSTFNPAKDGEMQLDDGGTYTFTSYYPHHFSGTADKVTTFTLYDMEQRHGTSSDHIGKWDFMWARKPGVQISGTESPQVNFEYKHIFPMLVFTIEQADTKKVKAISVRSADGATPVQGWVDVSLVNGKIEQVTSGKYYTSLTFTTPMTQDGTGRLLILPQAASAELIIGVLTTDNVIYEYTKTATKGLEGGKSYAFTFNLTDGYVDGRTVYPHVESNGTWQIDNESALHTFAMAVNYYKQSKINATLTANVTLSTYAAWETPIGIDLNYPYQGTFNGGGYTISNLNINRTSKNDYVGLFGYLNNNATVQNLRVTGNVTAENSQKVGGIAGYVHDRNSSIENCLFAGSVTGKLNVGGIAGESKGQITACFSSGSMTAKMSHAGGIAGNNGDKGNITQCYSSATVTATLGYDGGIAGYNNNTLSSCYATGTVSAATNYAGGIAGGNGKNNIKNCLALGSAVTRTSDQDTSFGRVIGGDDGGTITNCAAWEGMTLPDGITAMDNADGKDGAPLTTADCKKKTTYTSRDFDFTTPVWEFDNTGMYLPWIKAFESFHGINEADYRIAIPPHLKAQQN